MRRLPNPGRRSQPGSKSTTLGLFLMELPRNLRIDSVTRLNPSPPRAIDAAQPVAEAVRIMREAKVGCLLVTSAGRLVGIFTERDLLTRVLARELSLDSPIRRCMTADPVTVHPKDPVRVAIRRMQKGGYRHLPVVDESGGPVGILSAQQVVHYLAEHFPTLIFNQPPEPNQYPEHPEGS